MATNNPESFLLKKAPGAAEANYFILLTGACPQFEHFRCPLPARSFWKNAVVRSGNSSAFVASTNHFMILKKIRGVAGANYFILLTGACPQFEHFRCPLPARSFWKNAVVRSGNSSAFVASTNHFYDS